MKFMAMTLLTVLSLLNYAGAEGLPEGLPQGSLVLKCYDVSISKHGGAQTETDLEKFRVNETKFAFSTIQGRTVIETMPNVTAQNSNGLALLVQLSFPAGPKFVATMQSLVSADGHHASVIGNLPTASAANFSHLAVCGFKSR